MIVPINYFAAYKDQTSSLIKQIEGLYTEGITSITIAELEKSYPDSPEAHLQMVKDISFYLDKFHTPSNVVATAPTATTTTTTTDESVSTLSKTTAILLCLFLGGLGAHRFYAGKVGTGLVQLASRIMLLPVFLDEYNEDYLWAMTLAFIAINIWILVDLILICCGEFRDSANRKIKSRA